MMQTTYQWALAFVVAMALVYADSNTAIAQCRGGGRATGSAGGLSLRPSRSASLSATDLASVDSQAYANSPAWAASRPNGFAQQPLLTNRQQLLRQRAEQAYEREQELLAIRRDRAESIRAARNARTVARLQANRDAERPGSADSTAAMVAAMGSKQHRAL